MNTALCVIRSKDLLLITSHNDPAGLLNQLQAPFEAEMVFILHCLPKTAERVVQELTAKYSANRERGQWFRDLDESDVVVSMARSACDKLVDNENTE